MQYTMLGQSSLNVSVYALGCWLFDELSWNLPALSLHLDAVVIEELNKVTEAVKEKLGNNPDMWLAPSRMR